MSAKIWCVGTGKGGVGKTFTASSLAITLSKLGHSVLIVDFDITGANLHSTFGLPLQEKNLRLFLSGEEKLAQLIYPTQLPRLSYIQGCWDGWGPSQCDANMAHAALEEARSLPFQYVIFDLAPGISDSNLEFFKKCDERILITSPEPTSVEKTYRFIEALLCSELKEVSTPESYKNLEHSLRAYKNQNHLGHFSFRNYLKDAVGIDLNQFEGLSRAPVKLLVNSARSRQDQDLGYSIKSVATKYYDFNLDYLGPIDFDNSVWQAIKNREPVLIEKPFTPLAGQFLSIVKLLTAQSFHSNFYKAVV
jgi:flagellar biosynthesis protein FlhG